ncbi:MAG: hypothetical protein ACHQ50_11490 [Fimbriimonadales bacterium]
MAVSFALIGSAPSALPQQQPNAASQLVTKMLKYYSDLPSLTGSIVLTASDGAGQAQLFTQVQFEKPSKLFIKQVKSGNQSTQWLVVSDGKNFSYDAPQNALGSAPGQIGTPGSQNKRLYESVSQIEFVKGADGKYLRKYGNYDVQQIYSVGAATICDRSVPLDIAIGRHEDLQHDVLTWMTVSSNGKTTVNEVEANSIVGKWRPYGDAATDPNQAPGQYELVITDDGKLLRYTIVQNIRRSPPNQSDVVELRETWNVDLNPNGKPDESLFRVV